MAVGAGPLTGTPADGDSMQVAPAREMGTDVFANIQAAIDALRSPVLNDADQAALDNALATATAVRAKIRKLAPDRDPIQTHRGFGYSYQPGRRTSAE